jgi:hypothetical protein
MKGLTDSFRARAHKLVVLSAACAGFLLNSQAQYTLHDVNSSVTINPSAQTGMLNWFVDGQNQLYQQWFWYRVGSAGPEHSIDTIGTPSVSTNANTLTATYNAGYFNMGLTYSLRGGAAGSGVSDVGEQITINNTSGSNMVLHFFQYSDFDLGGTPGGDTIQLDKNLQGKFNEAFQWKGNISLTETFSDTVATPGADHGEAAFFNQTLTELNDALATTLNDNAGPVGPGDVTWAFEWDLAIANGSSVIISKDKNLQIQIIPEPAALSLLALGIAGWFFRSRRSAR